ncbi:telomerase reverse transcriptase isoform 1 [Aphelenchoides avenae]|nr:telomerase reverse transcriptase isoform 1 [Aphelenchus avenae]
MELDAVLPKKKKRERRKKCRAKPWKTEETKLKALEEEATRTPPTAVDLLHKSVRRPFNQDQLINVAIDRWSTYRDKTAAKELVPVKAVLDFVMEENKMRLGMGVKSLTTFHAKYRRVVLSERKKPSAERYWCSADLSNCFTAMNHATLERILCELIPSDKVYTIVSFWVRNRIAKRNYRKYVAGASYSDAKSRFRPKRYEEADSSSEIKKVSGGEVLALIRKHALRTVIHHGNRMFVCNRGIPQGNPLSVRLCNIYLGFMEHTLFPKPPRKVMCVRYVDDYFLTSTDKQQISEVVEKLFDYDPRFETRFNDKARTSFACKGLPPSSMLRPNEKLTFCGYAINRKTLSVTVDYKRYRHKHPSYVPPRSITDPETARQLICSTVKRLCASRFRQFRRCYQLFRQVRRRRQLRRGFLRFVSEHYLMHFARKMRLRWSDRATREFFEQTLRWVGQNFRSKATPTAAPALEKKKR